MLVYSHQLHYANGLLGQLATQVWAYPHPHYYQKLINTSLTLDFDCLKGNQCNGIDMTQAWATHWQQSLLHNLPGGELNLQCNGSCTQGNH